MNRNKIKIELEFYSWSYAETFTYFFEEFVSLFYNSDIKFCIIYPFFISTTNTGNRTFVFEPRFIFNKMKLCEFTHSKCVARFTWVIVFVLLSIFKTSITIIWYIHKRFNRFKYGNYIIDCRRLQIFIVAGKFADEISQFHSITIENLVPTLPIEPSALRNSVNSPQISL